MTEEFESLGLSEQLLGSIRKKGFETPSPIQKLAIPVLLCNQNDIIAQAQTGTGKTAAFGLPILDLIVPTPEHDTQALILVPTRELAIQVTEEIQSFNNPKLSIATIYGGASISEQLRRLKKGIDIVVGTPGRILDHLRRGTLKLGRLRWLVLDEADEMLNMGFIEDVEEIMSQAGDDRRVLLFSATMPQRIVALSKKYMRDVEILRVEAKQMTADLTDQIYFEVRESDKLDALTRIIDVEQEFYGIVFCRTKVGVDELTMKLLERGYAAESLHGDVSQASREKILRKFKQKQVNILIATDVAARGIDVNNLTHVINYSLPQDSESYVHRIGRTGRAGNQGTAITFISSSEYRQFRAMEREVKAEIRKEMLPSPQDIIAIKKTKIMDDLAEIVDNDLFSEYLPMAQQILREHDAELALSALMKLAFKSELEESNYPEIRSINVDRRGTARLFIAMGSRDGLTPRILVKKLKQECGVSDSKINDVSIGDTFSFVTVPFSDAGAIVKTLNRKAPTGRPMAEIAKENKGAAGGRGKDFLDEAFPGKARKKQRKSDYNDRPFGGAQGKSPRDKKPAGKKESFRGENTSRKKKK